MKTVGHVVQEEALHDVLRHVIGPLRVEDREARPRHFFGHLFF